MDSTTTTTKAPRDLSAAHEGRRRAARLRRFEKMIEELRAHGYTVTAPRQG